MAQRPDGAGRSAGVQRRPAGRGPHRRRPVGPGLRRRSPGGVPRGPAVGAHGRWRGRLRWTQTGFNSNAAAEDTPRNLMGFKDGTQNPIAVARPSASAETHPTRPARGVVWAGDEGPAWMRGGSYLVVRRIRIALEHWDNTDLDFQEETIGRHKYSGAPLGGKHEFDPLDLDAEDADGNPVIADNAHVRLAAAASNDGAQMLRRGYSYNDGVNITAERWPPWRQRAGIRCRAAVHLLPARPAHRVHQAVRRHGQAGCAEPVRDSHGRRPVRLPARRRGRPVHRPGAVRVGVAAADCGRRHDGIRPSLQRWAGSGG